MATSVTNNFDFPKIVTGAEAGVWGDDITNALITPLDGALGATLGVAITAADVTLTLAQWSQNAAFKLTGALTGNHNLILPLTSAQSPDAGVHAVGGKFVVDNETTSTGGPWNVTVITAVGGSTGVVVPNGTRSTLYSDGTNVMFADDSRIAKLNSFAGNPNGSVAGTAASVNTPADLIWDRTNGILYVCTTSGNAASAVWSAITGQVVAPQGYLTLGTALVPIIGGDVIGSPNVNYQPLIGNTCPIFTGSVFSQVPFASSQVTATAGAQSANGLYDVFAFLNAGVFTLAFGPSWLAGGGNQTAGSCARGAGAGSTQITRINGIWVNNFALTTANNSITTYNIPQFQGTYLGTVYIDASAGQVTCHRSYGQSRKFGVWNAYNRVPITLQGGDPTASWSTGTSTGTHVSNNAAGNYLTTLCGLAEEQTACSFNQFGNGTNAVAKIGIGYNNSGVFSGTQGQLSSNNNQGSNLFAQFDAAPSLGINNVYASEAYISGAASTMSGTQANMLLRAQWRG